MTKKHFEAIAHIINSCWIGKNESEYLDASLIAMLCRYFGSVNPLFNEAKFRNACCTEKEPE